MFQLIALHSAGAKGHPKAKGKATPDPEPLKTVLPEGELLHHLQLPITVATCDWLDQGIKLQLWKASRSAVMDPLTDKQRAQLADPKAKKNGVPACNTIAVLACMKRTEETLP
jgi:hypothetical protein